MKVEGVCEIADRRDRITDIVMSECSKSNPKTVWSIVGGHLVSYECFKAWTSPNTSSESNQPDIFLSAENCDSTTDLEMTSLTSSSDDNTRTYWVMIPDSFSGSGDELIDF